MHQYDLGVKLESARRLCKTVSKGERARSSVASFSGVRAARQSSIPEDRNSGVSPGMFPNKFCCLRVVPQWDRDVPVAYGIGGFR